MKTLSAFILCLVCTGAHASDWWVYRNHQCEPAPYTPEDLVKIHLSRVDLDDKSKGWVVMSEVKEKESLIYFGNTQEACTSLGKALENGQLATAG